MAGLRRAARPSPVAQVAESVEDRIENPRVGGAIPSLGTIFPLLPLRPRKAALAKYGLRLKFSRDVELINRFTLSDCVKIR